MKKVVRKFLEIKSLIELKEVLKPNNNYNLKLINPKDFQLNKFLYKQVGKEYYWVDRLMWTDSQWIDYVNSEHLSTYVLKDNQDITGYFELILHVEKKEAEVAYFGILEKYFGKKLGGYLLSQAIKISFSLGAKRVWLHTCSLDHKNALNNYLSRGMKIFNTSLTEVNYIN